MAQFQFWNEVNGLLNMDGPITKGPIPRHQRRKLRECQQQSTSSTSLSSKTPTKSVHDVDNLRSTKTPSSKSKTPGKTTKLTKTPTPSKGDRFIPSRSASNFDLAHYKISKEDECDVNNVASPSKFEMERILSENLHGLDINKQRILSYQNKAPSAPEGFQNPMRVIYTQSKTPASVKNSSRYIPQAPDRILDAPDIVDDYYLNLMDWGGNNILAAALGAHVYLWNAGKY